MAFFSKAGQGFVRSLLPSLLRYAKVTGAVSSPAYEKLTSANQRDSQQNSDLSQYTDQAKLLTVSDWVYMAVNFIATEGAQVEFELFENNEQLTAHPLLDLLQRPSDTHSAYELKQAMFGFLTLNGNCYLFQSRADDRTPPSAIVPLRPDRVRIMVGTNANKPIAGYMYTVGGVDVALDAHEVIHAKRWNPSNDYYGLSPLQAAAITVQTDLAMAVWNRNTFGRDMAVPAGVVNIKTNVSSDTLDEIKSEWTALYGGQNRKTAFIRNSEIDFQQIGLTHNELDFLNSRQFHKETILQVFGVPPGMLDKNATEANANASREVFNNGTLWPMAVAIADTLTSRLAPAFGEGLAIRPKDFRVRNTHAEQLELTAYAPYMTINEARERYMKLPAVKWGDIPASGSAAQIAVGLIAGGSATPATLPSLMQPPNDPQVDLTQIEPDAIELSKSMRDELAQFERFVTHRVGTARKADIDLFSFKRAPYPLALAYRAAADIGVRGSIKIAPAADRYSVSGHKDPLANEKERHANELKIALALALLALRNSILSGIQHIGTANSAVYAAYFNALWWQQAAAALTDALYGAYYDVLYGATIDTTTLFAMDSGIETDIATLTPDVIASVEQWVNGTLTQVASTSADGLNALLTRWSAGGTPQVRDLQNAVNNSPLFGNSRAETIAETETTGAFGQAVQITTQAAAKITRTKKLFTARQLAEILPAHPNCRCWTEPELNIDADGVISGVDARWYAAHDDRVCLICLPRDGKMVSEILGALNT